jgi:hypothetical protein
MPPSPAEGRDRGPLQGGVVRVALVGYEGRHPWPQAGSLTLVLPRWVPVGTPLPDGRRPPAIICLLRRAAGTVLAPGQVALFRVGQNQGPRKPQPEGSLAESEVRQAIRV